MNRAVVNLIWANVIVFIGLFIIRLLPFGDAELLGAWAIYRPAVTGGVSHRVTSTQPVGLSAYGYDCDVSYAYPGGLNLEATR
jgi:hypothetical protein